MKKLVIGSLAVMVGWCAFAFNLTAFINLLAGALPVMLILGGAAAVYLGIEDRKAQKAGSPGTAVTSEAPGAGPVREPAAPAQMPNPVSDRADTLPRTEQAGSAPDQAEAAEPAGTVEPDAGEPSGADAPLADAEASLAEIPVETPGEKPGEIPGETPEETSEAPVSEAVEPEVSPVQYRGNVDTLVFHSIACNFSQGVKCTHEFTTRDEAIDQGYKPCKVCNP